MRLVLTTALLVGGLALPQGADAQSNPSSQQIIDQLRPGGNILGGPTRGIRPVSPAAPADTGTQPAAAATPAPTGSSAPVPAAARPPVAAVAPSAPSVNLTVNFASGSAELTPQAIRTLDELGRALASADLSGFRFRVEGHTDTVGNPMANQSLSERRAAAVVQYLTAKFGIAPSRLQAVGMGESAPLVPTGDEVSEPRNRRVQVVNLGT
ncbi:OmpA family protein [Falsiroseomonas sp. HW251]|uniref:OmpA family protein n=1 Tax=Falsiroseomonas sp. HW251 TaxID=3390998 RepID=UPI003D318B05